MLRQFGIIGPWSAPWTILTASKAPDPQLAMTGSTNPRAELPKTARPKTHLLP